MKMVMVITWLCVSLTASAEKLKLAVLAPEGTTWSNSLKDMAKEVKEKTAGRVEFKIYFGGVAGDEPDVLRKIRIGQIDGGIFTGKTLGDIFSDIRVMELPFNFKNRKIAFSVLEKMGPYFRQGFAAKGFEVLGLYEIGQVYLVSTRKVLSMEALKGVKVWSWEGDPVVEAMIKSLNLNSISLGLPDVLSAFSTGMIEAAYSSPLGILALQWQNKIKFLIDVPVAYSVGALIIRASALKKLTKEDQKIVAQIANKLVGQANAQNAVENDEALQGLKKQGIEFVKFPDSDIKRGQDIRHDVLSKLKGKVISPLALKTFAEAH